LFGFTHWIIVLLIALVVFGPEKLPELARTLGRALAEFRRASADFRRVVEDELYDIERQTREKQQREAANASPAPALPEPAGTIPAGAAGAPSVEVSPEPLPAPLPEAATPGSASTSLDHADRS
jgi:TatA/E family protein of Tat protein translocase